MGTQEYAGRVRARGHDVGIRESFSMPQGGLRSLQERQLQYKVETRCKYEQGLEDLKARMKAMEDMSNGCQSAPIDH